MSPHLRTSQVSAAAALALFTTLAAAQALSVRAERPDRYKVVSGNTAWNIVLDGEIDIGAAARVASALALAGNDGADVYINSPGGNLLEGMRIGRLIRRAGANTWIGKVVLTPPNSPGGQPLFKRENGSCHSACTLVFLGGVYRFVGAGDEYGVHRFSSTAPPSTSDLDAAQVISAAVGAYIREMDVDPALFELMVERGRDSVRLLTGPEMTKLNVANHGRKRAEWMIEAVTGGQYLRGVQDTIYGSAKAVFFCQERVVHMYSFYGAGAARAKSLATEDWQHSLLLDDKTLPLPKPKDARANGEEFSASFALTAQQVAGIAKSSSVGHAMQVSRDAPTFVGYKIDVPNTASKRVASFLQNCVTLGR